MAKLKSIKLWMYVVVALVCVFSLLLLWVAKTPRSSNSGNNSSSSNSSDSQNTNSTATSAPLQDPTIAQKYDLVGIRADDTVAVVSSSDNTEIVINLEHKQWKDPQWSPDKKLIAVLGKNAKVESSSSTSTKSSSTTSSAAPIAVYDLYLYNLADGSWTQATAYTQLEKGITGYLWQDGDIIAFTQGTSPDDWVHNYSVSSNEIRKLFKVDGGITSYATNPARYITNDASDSSVGNVYRVYSNTGKVEYTFVGRAVEANTKLTKLIPGSDNNEFVLFLSNSKSYFWSFNKPAFVNTQFKAQGNDETLAAADAVVNVVCAQTTGYYGWNLSKDAKKLALINLQSDGSYTLVQSVTAISAMQVDAASASCTSGKFLAKVSLSNSPKWYLLTAQNVQEISVASSYSQLVMRPN